MCKTIGTSRVKKIKFILMVEFITCSRSNGVVVVVVVVVEYGTTAQRWALASCFSGFEKCNVNLLAQSIVWRTKSMYL
jgi:hypothetical protein